MAVQRVNNLAKFLDSGKQSDLVRSLVQSDNLKAARRVQQIEAKPPRLRTAQENAYVAGIAKNLGQGNTLAEMPVTPRIAGSTDAVMYPGQLFGQQGMDVGASIAPEVDTAINYGQALRNASPDDVTRGVQLFRNQPVNDYIYRPEMTWGNASDIMNARPETGAQIIASNPGVAVEGNNFLRPVHLGLEEVREGRPNLDFTLPGAAGQAAASNVARLIDQAGGPQAYAGRFLPGQSVEDTLNEIYGKIQSGQLSQAFPAGDPMAWPRVGTVQDVPRYLMGRSIDPDTGVAIPGREGRELTYPERFRSLIDENSGVAGVNQIPGLGYQPGALPPQNMGIRQNPTFESTESYPVPHPAFGVQMREMPVQRRVAVPPSAYETSISNPVSSISSVVRNDQSVDSLREIGQQAQAKRLADTRVHRKTRDIMTSESDAIAREAIAARQIPVGPDDYVQYTYQAGVPRESEYGYAGRSGHTKYSNLDHWALEAGQDGHVVPGVGSRGSGGLNVQPLKHGPGRFGTPANAYIAVRDDINKPYTSTNPSLAWMQFDPPHPTVRENSLNSLFMPTQYKGGNAIDQADRGIIAQDAVLDAPIMLQRKMALEQGAMTRAYDRYRAMGGDDKVEILQYQIADRLGKGQPAFDLENQLRPLAELKQQIGHSQQKVGSLMNSQEAMQGSIARAWTEMGHVDEFMTAVTRTPAGNVVEDLPIDEVVRRNQASPTRQVLNLPQNSPDPDNTFVTVNGEQVPVSKEYPGWQLYGTPDSTSIVTKSMDEAPEVLAVRPGDKRWNSAELVYRKLHAVDPTVEHNQLRQGVQYVQSPDGKNVVVLNAGRPVQGKAPKQAMPYEMVGAPPVGEMGPTPVRYKEQRARSKAEQDAMLQAERAQARQEGYYVREPESAAIDLLPDALGQLNAQRMARGLQPLNLTEVNAMGGLDVAQGQLQRQTGLLGRVNEREVDNYGFAASTLQDVRRQLAERTYEDRAGRLSGQLRALARQVLQQPTTFRQASIPREEIIGGLRAPAGVNIANLNAQRPTAQMQLPLRYDIPLLPRRSLSSGPVLNTDFRPDHRYLVADQATASLDPSLTRDSSLSPTQARLARDAEAQRLRDEVNSLTAASDRRLASAITGSSVPMDQPIQGNRTLVGPTPFPEATGDRMYTRIPLPQGLDAMPTTPKGIAYATRAGENQQELSRRNFPIARQAFTEQLMAERDGLRNLYAQARATGDTNLMNQVAAKGKLINHELSRYGQ
jgi:hypothetical protein